MKTVILHGLGQTPRDWESVAGLIPASEIDCPDLLSAKETAPLTYPNLLGQLEARYANTKGALRLCGLSLGAVLALDYATRHPDRVAELVLIAGQFKSPTLLLELQILIFHLMPDNAFQDTGLSKKSMIQLTRSMRHLDLSTRLAQVICPVAVVCGKKDRFNMRAAKKLTALLPQGALHIVPNSGHEVNRTAPEAIADILNR